MTQTNSTGGQGIYAVLERLLRATDETRPLKVLRNPLTKPNVTIIEDENEIVLDFAEFTITVRSKKS